MTAEEFATFCREHGACSVDLDSPIEVSFALELLHEFYYDERQCGSGWVPKLRDVYNQIAMIDKILI